MKLDICLPAYNEEKILQESTLHLLQFCQQQEWNFDWQIIILVNGSTDKSFDIASTLANNNQNIQTHNYPVPSRGRTLKQYGLTSQADILAYMDIDLATDLTHLPELITAIHNNNYDLAIGSRLLADSQIERSLIREFVSQGYNFISRLILNHKLSDLQCGFKAINLDIFRQLAPLLSDNHWFFDTELVILTKKHGYKIKEIPVSWSENRYQTRRSKVNLIKDPLIFLYNLLKLRHRLKKLK